MFAYLEEREKIIYNYRVCDCSIRKIASLTNLTRGQVFLSIKKIERMEKHCEMICALMEMFQER